MDLVKNPYVELHAASAFSFLDGASLPEDLAECAAQTHLSALAVIDANGVYGAPRFYKAARAAGIRPIIGAEVNLAWECLPAALRAPRDRLLLCKGHPPPRLTFLVASRVGYRNLCRLLTECALGRPKGQIFAHWDQIALHSEGLYCLTGGEEGPLAWIDRYDTTPEPSRQFLSRLKTLFPSRLYVELQRHRRRDQEHWNRRLINLARLEDLPLIATNGVRYARRKDKDLYDVLCCIRKGLSLDEAKAQLNANRERHLKSPDEMMRLFHDLPEAIGHAAQLASLLNFTLADLGYEFPDFPHPPKETPISYLRRITWEGAQTRFRPVTAAVRAQIEKELTLIGKLELAGYFLIVWDIVQFCRRERILVQGRGSAANSAVCYALSITAVDPIKMELIFERFLSEERREWPDIDLDLPSGNQRERVIQYLYGKYGAQSAAMTANVITYRPRSAIRDVAKAFGLPMEQQNRLSDHLGSLSSEEIRAHPGVIAERLAESGVDPRSSFAARLVRLWLHIQTLPRHLGQHSGGMVMARGRLDDVVALEPATMPGRVVVQWDKDDCADLGIIKVDLLGLGMLAALEEALPLIARHEGIVVDLAHLPPDDPKVFQMINDADTVGIFQLESRAQMATLPRHAPKKFYDIVVQVAIIRPGPIVGGMVRPFFDRRAGKAPVEYPHPSLEPVLKRTLGVPLFQEQILRMAMITAGLTGGEAEELRRAIGFKRSQERMAAIERKIRAGMTRNGVTGAAQDQIIQMITSFALYGFPESHAASFALIAYASAYLKAYHPAAFYISLLNCWPMGFYHPATLVKDAQRHGVRVLPIDVNSSGWTCRWEKSPGAQQAFRIGLRFIKGLREASGLHIEKEREGSPFRHLEDLALRCHLGPEELGLLAHAGALASLGMDRREALWQVAKVGRFSGPLLEGTLSYDPSPLRPLSGYEQTLADYESAALTAGPHLMAHVREDLAHQQILSASELAATPEGRTVKTAGSVIVRQQPQTAKGFVFITLEDETGLSQAILSPALFHKHRSMIIESPGLVIQGVLQKDGQNPSVKATACWPLSHPAHPPSHDFH